MSMIAKMNRPTSIAAFYNDIVSGEVYNRGFKRPKTQDKLLPLVGSDETIKNDPIVLNHQYLANLENQRGGYLYFYPPIRGLTDNQYDDYMTVAAASGAVNFLKTNNFKKSLYDPYPDSKSLTKFINLLQQMPYPLPQNKIKFLLDDTPNQPTKAPTKAPTQAPTKAPTQAPTQDPTQDPCEEVVAAASAGRILPSECPKCSECSECSECPKCSEKNISTEKQIYISLLGALIFLLLSLPVIYKVTNIVFGLIGVNTQTEYGSPTYAGLFIHFIVYFLLVFLIMKIT